MRIENSVLRSLFGITRLCRVMPHSDPEERNFLSAPNTHVGFFFLHTFRFRMSYFKSSITTHNDVDIGHFKITSLWRRNDVNLTTKLRDVLYNQGKPNSREKKYFFGWDNVGEIRISISSENLGFPNLVCKKYCYEMSHVTRKSVCEVSDHVRLKPVCAATDAK